MLIQEDKSATLSTSNVQTLFQPVAYPNKTGCLYAHMDRGFNGQEADNDMLVVESHPYTKQNNTEYTEGIGTLKACGGDIGGADDV